MKNDNTIPPMLLSREDAANYIGCSTRSLDASIKAGLLPVVQHGSRRLVPRAALEELHSGGGRVAVVAKPRRTGVAIQRRLIQVSARPYFPKKGIGAWSRDYETEQMTDFLEVVPAYRLAALALQYGARIRELRTAGYEIHNRTKRVGRQVHGEFRLMACPGETPITNAADDGEAH